MHGAPYQNYFYKSANDLNNFLRELNNILLIVNTIFSQQGYKIMTIYPTLYRNIIFTQNATAYNCKIILVVISRRFIYDVLDYWA